nr:transcriptional regulator [Clostridium neonatale]
MKNEEKTYLEVKDVMEIIGIKQTKAYQIIRALNKELNDKGYITVAGKVPRKYFKEKYYC